MKNESGRCSGYIKYTVVQSCDSPLNATNNKNEMVCVKEIKSMRRMSMLQNKNVEIAVCIFCFSFFFSHLFSRLFVFVKKQQLHLDTLQILMNSLSVIWNIHIVYFNYYYYFFVYIFKYSLKLTNLVFSLLYFLYARLLIIKYVEIWGTFLVSIVSLHFSFMCFSLLFPSIQCFPSKYYASFLSIELMLLT